MNEDRKHYFGVKLKTMGLAALGAIIIMAIASTFFSQYTKSLVYQFEYERFETITRIVASSADYGLRTKDRRGLDHTMAKAFSENDVIGVGIFSDDADWLTVKGEGFSSEIQKEVIAGLAKLPHKTESQRVFGSLQEGVIGLSYPVVANEEPWEESGSPESPTVSGDQQILGNIVILFDLGRMQAELRQMQGIILVMFNVLLLLILLGAGVLATILVSRLKTLLEAMKRLRSGDLNVRVNIESNDEIEELAENFNEMAEDLQLTTVSKDYVDQVISSMQDALIVVDPQMVVRTVNESTCRLLGYAEYELIGMPIETLFSSDIKSQLFLEQVRKREHMNKRSDVLLRTSRGSSVEATISQSAMMTGTTYHGTVCVAQDITQRKQFERALEEAIQSAQTAMRLKSEFLANMSHEIRTPMNAVIGMTGFLMDSKLSDEQRDFVETIRQSSEALLGIINDILDFSKIEAGKLELENRAFDIRHCVEGAVDITVGLAVGKGIDLLYEIDSKVPSAIMGDEIRLRQIMVNLLNNAIKFTEQGEVVLRAHFEEHPGKGHLLVSVEDTGIGIPEEKIEHLFESFSQVDSSTTRRYGGTGLGLTICKQLVELMGGRVSVKSKLGKGSEFRFEIPIEVAPTNRVRPFQKGEQEDLSNKQVLLVDDNDTNLTILERQLASWGMKSKKVYSGQEAIEAAQRFQPFDVILMDMQMPAMDGVTTARCIREIESARQTPIILISSIGASPEEHKELFAGQLTKPVKPSQLFDQLLVIFSKDLVSEESAAPPKPEPLPVNGAAQILVAEDHPVNQKVVRMMLNKLGYQVQVVENGQQAIEALNRGDFAAVLMDCQMPILDGYEATSRIRSMPVDWSEIPIIAMTAHAMQGDEERCRQAGMSDYVSKPVKAEKLRQLLAKWVNGNGSSEEV